MVVDYRFRCKMTYQHTWINSKLMYYTILWSGPEIWPVIDFIFFIKRMWMIAAKTDSEFIPDSTLCSLIYLILLTRIISKSKSKRPMCWPHTHRDNLDLNPVKSWFKARRWNTVWTNSDCEFVALFYCALLWAPQNLALFSPKCQCSETTIKNDCNS